MSKFFTRFYLGIVTLLLLLAASFLYYHHKGEEDIAVMHQQGALRNINEGVYDIMRIRGEKHFNDSCAEYVLRYVSHYGEQPLRVTVVVAETGDVLFDSSLPSGAGFTGNHAGRPEIKQALAEGYGYDVRRLSSVHNKEYFYVATYHPEYDFVVRSSLPYELALKTDRTAELILIIVAGVIMAVVLFMIYRIIKLAGSSEFATQKLLQHLRIAQEGIAIFDSKRRLVFANSLFSEYADYISSKNLAKVDDILKQPEFAGFKRFIDLDGYYNNEHKSHYSEKIEVSGRTFAIRGVPFRDKGFEISINDVTAVEEQSRLKRQLTQNVAHEFKTPVCSIQGYLETIIQNYPGNLTEEQLMHFLKRCYSQSDRLSNLVQDISQLNDMSGGVQRIDKELIDLSRLVRNLLGEVGNKLSEQRMTVENMLPPTLLINADNSKIYSIFRNLIDNAISYAGEGSTVKISCFRTDEKFFYFSFSDNGTGVPEEHLARLFERFYRVDKGRSRKLGGTGLGLSIVKNAVSLHGGTISVRNVPGGGLEFVFKLQR